jgi:phospholipase C
MAGLESIDHVVLVMLENRSFDQLLGFLYPKGDDFDGLDGSESNLTADGTVVKVSKITADMENAYYYPLANPSEGYPATTEQLFSSSEPPTDGVAKMDGFVTSFANELAHPKYPDDPKLVGAEPASIMAMYAPEVLPVLTGLAKGFAVCDRWFASVPTQTFPNRAFAVAGTAPGYVDNSAKGTPTFDTPSVFGLLDQLGKTWKIYGWTGPPYTGSDFPDTVKPGPNGEVVDGFARFQSDAAGGKLPNFAYVEPAWAKHPKPGAPASTVAADDKVDFEVENDEHPVSNLAVGEKALYDIYQALRSNPEAWAKTLLIVTYDEHGGNFDHVPPPTGATRPDDIVGLSKFDYTRFGVRVPAVLVSPLIPPGTKLRPPAGGPPFDHTSIIATLRACFGIGALKARDAKAPDVGGALTLAEARTDDPLDGIVLPAVNDPVLADGSAPVGDAPTSFVRAKALAAAMLPIPGDEYADPEDTVASLTTASRYHAFIEKRLSEWDKAGRPMTPRPTGHHPHARHQSRTGSPTSPAT